MLSILIRKQEIMKNGQYRDAKLVLSCVSNDELQRKSRVIDPILDEMYMIRFQPFYDFGRQVGGDWKSPLRDTCTLRFKSWDERLLNHIVDTPCMRYNADSDRSVNHV